MRDPLPPNRLLTLIARADPSIADAAGEIVLAQREMFVHAGDTPTELCFPLNCVLSVLVRTRDGPSTEVAAIGNEGCAGIEALFDGRSRADIVVQVPGRAVRMPAAAMRARWDENAKARSIMGRYIMALVGQFSQTAACNRLHPVEARAARWLLMTADRAGSESFPVTHEFLAAMLGANRTTVTLALRSLQRAGVITVRRSGVEITDRDALESISCECYETIKASYEALYG